VEDHDWKQYIFQEKICGLQTYVGGLITHRLAAPQPRNARLFLQSPRTVTGDPATIGIRPTITLRYSSVSKYHPAETADTGQRICAVPYPRISAEATRRPFMPHRARRSGASAGNRTVAAIIPFVKYHALCKAGADHPLVDADTRLPPENTFDNSIVVMERGAISIGCAGKKLPS
jgi:hypothetical protein